MGLIKLILDSFETFDMLTINVKNRRTQWLIVYIVLNGPLYGTPLPRGTKDKKRRV